MPEFSVKKPLTIFVATIAILVLGVVAYVKMTPDLLPNMDFPYVIIVTTSPGDSPESVEAEITKPMEQAMATLEGIVNVTSNSADSYSMVMLEFQEGTNLDTVGVDIQQKIVTLQGAWDDTVSAPYVLKINPSMLPVAMAAVAMDGKEIIDLSDFMDDTLMSRLEGISGVARVTATGTVDQQLHVIISQEKIDALNKTVAKGINKQMDKAANSLRAAKNQINSALSSMGNASSNVNTQIPTPDTSGVDAEIAAKQAQRLSIQNTITQLESIQAALNSTPVDNSAAIAAKQAEIAGYDSQLTDLNRQIADVEAAIAAENAKISAAQSALDSHNSSKPDGSDQLLLEAWETENAKLTTQLEAVKAESEPIIAGHNSTKSDLNSQRMTLQARKTAAEVELNNLQTEGQPITEAEAQLRLNALGLSITPDQIPDEIARQQADLAAVDAEIAQLTSQRNDQITAVLPSTDQITGMLSTLAESMMKMSSAMSQIDSGLNSIESSRKEALKQANLDNVLSLETVSQLLYAQNFSMPAGYVEQDGISYMVSVGDNFSSVEELENLVLLDFGLDDMDPICLGDIADVFVTNNADSIYTRLGTNPGIMLQFEKQSNYATAEVSENIQNRFAELEKEFPGLEFFLLMDQGDYIMYIVSSILESLLAGAVFSVVILFIFLKDIRPTFITLCSIPLSLVAAIVLMYFSGVTLNMISLSALSISVGMLVDNSIVVIENIYRLRSLGANAIQAAVSGAKQVLGAITSSTLTTVCVFAPIVFVEGITRQLFMDMALTMGYALMASLVVALTFVPAMASKLLKDDKALKEDLMANVYGKYRYAVAWALDHKAIVLGVAMLMLVASAGLAIARGFTFMPEMDSNTVTVTLSFDAETTMEEAMADSDKLLARVAEIEAVDTVGATMSTGTDGSQTVTMYVLLPEGSPGGVVADEVLTMCEDLRCEASASSAMMDMSMLTGGSGVTLNIYGNDMDDLQAAALTIGEALEAVPGIDTVSNGLEDASTAIHVTIDRKKAIEKGYTTAQLYMELATKMTTSATATSFDLNGYNIDVIVEKPEEKKVTLDSLLSQTFTPSSSMSDDDEDFTLADVATIEEITSLTTINRENQQRYLTITGTLTEGHNVTLVTADAQAVVDGLKLPDSVTVDFGGENEMIMEALQQMILMLLLGMMLVYFIMVAQFQSLKSPFIVMFTIPLAFTGGFLALLLTGYEVSIISMIGFVMLVGIIVNNGIVLVEYINQLRADGVSRREAILEAGVTRVRPILMTTLTTILGQLVMASGKDMGTALVQPMAIVCIGGLLYATLMTLFVVPVIYDMVCKNELDIVNEEDLVILDL